LIVDDDRLFAEALTWSLERLGMVVVGVATRAEEAVGAARLKRPDLVLVGLRVPGPGLRAGRALLSGAPGARIVAVTPTMNPQTVRMVLDAGFHGCVSKDLSMREFAESVRLALEGRAVVVEPRGEPSAREERGGPRLGVQSPPPLTRRELQVLGLLAEGANNREIAARLGISGNTVRSHVQNILTKLQVHSRLEAVAYGIRNALVEVPGRRGGR
jgi:two-component system nitrate/nitrite response regulator NarL